MRSRFLAFYSLYARVVTWFSVLAGAMLFGLMFLICANSLSRKLFNFPIVGTLEITEALMPFVILLPMAFTQMRDGHIRVTLVTDRLPRPVRRILRTVMLLIGALFFAWVAVATVGFAWKAFTIGETAWGVIRIPLWPSKSVISLGAALLSIQYVLDTVRIGFLDPSADRDGLAHVAAEAEGG